MSETGGTLPEKEVELTDSIQRLNETSQTLADVLVMVQKTQQTMAAIQGVTESNTDAILLASTKDELVKEVARLARERHLDRTKTKWTVGITFAISLVLIFVTAITTAQFKSVRHDSNITYQSNARLLCEQRSQSWVAMAKWINVQKQIELGNPYISETFRAKRITALDELIKSFPVVDCTVAGSGLASVPLDPSGMPRLDGGGNESALRLVSP